MFMSVSFRPYFQDLSYLQSLLHCGIVQKLKYKFSFTKEWVPAIRDYNCYLPFEQKYYFSLQWEKQSIWGRVL